MLGLNFRVPVAKETKRKKPIACDLFNEFTLTEINGPLPAAASFWESEFSHTFSISRLINYSRGFGGVLLFHRT
jgi:hypothetical protein